MERQYSEESKKQLTIKERIEMLDKMIKEREKDLEILRQWRRQLMECSDE